MKKILIGVCIAIAPCVAMAENIPNANQWKYYISGNIGGVVSDVDIKDDSYLDFGGITTIEFGAQYNRYRLGLAWQSRAETSEILQVLIGHTASIKNDALRLNGYFDYISTEHFSMYVGAGLGVNRYDYTIQSRWPKYEESKHGASFIGGFSTGMIFSGDHFGFDIGFIFDYISYPRAYSYGPTIGLRYVF